MLDSHLEFRYQIKKNISIDKYDTESDEEDHIREEEEIKRIIMKAKMKNLATPHQDTLTTSNDPEPLGTFEVDEPKTIKNETILKSKSHQGFFPTIAGSLEQVDKKGTIENFEKFFSSKQNKEKRKDQANSNLQTYYVDYEKQGTEKLIQRVIGTSQTKFKEINKVSFIDQEFQKRSFQNLLSLFDNSTSGKPIKLFTERLYLPHERNSSKVKKISQGDNPSLSNNTFQNIPNLYDQEKEGKISKKQFHRILCDLISAFLLNAYEPINKSAQYDLPRMKMIDWSSLIKKNGAKRFELLIINPIKLEVEDCLEIHSENPQEVKNFMHEAIKEVTPSMNEAKHILVYYYDDDSMKEKKLLFHKFFFFLKNHRNYEKGFKNEKEVIMYYLLVLGLLQLKITYENNPFKEGKIEALKKKAFDILKNNDEIPSFVINWFIKKAQPIINIEKVYINLNVGGKADSNFTFSLHKHLTYTFPKFSNELHRSQSKAPIPNKRTNKYPPFLHSNIKEPLNLNQTQNQDQFRGSYHTSISSNKAEFSPSVVDYINRQTEDTRYSNSLRLFNLKKDKLPSNLDKLSSPKQRSQASQDPFSGKQVASGGFVPKRFGFRGDEPPFEFYGKNEPLSTLHSPKESKIYLINPRMNTSYSTLLRQRINKKF